MGWACGEAGRRPAQCLAHAQQGVAGGQARSTLHIWIACQGHLPFALTPQLCGLLRRKVATESANNAVPIPPNVVEPRGATNSSVSKWASVGATLMPRSICMLTSLTRSSASSTFS